MCGCRAIGITLTHQDTLRTCNVPNVLKNNDYEAGTTDTNRAHQDNDRAVMAAYGFSTKMTESDCVAELFRLYEEMVKG